MKSILFPEIDEILLNRDAEIKKLKTRIFDLEILLQRAADQQELAVIFAIDEEREKWTLTNGTR